MPALGADSNQHTVVRLFVCQSFRLLLVIEMVYVKLYLTNL